MRYAKNRPITLSAAACLLAAAGTTLAQEDATEQPAEEPTATEAAPVTAPKYNNLRFNEDWKGFEGGDDKWDSIKFIPLNDEGSNYLSLGGQVRLRNEIWGDFGFNDASAADDTFTQLRLRFHGDLHIGEHFRAFVEVKSSHMTDRDLPGSRRASDVDTLDLQNAFIDVNFSPGEKADLTFRGGRQELSFGKQRLVSPLDWSNTRRTFEGVRVIADFKGWEINPFWTELVAVDKYEFNDTDSGVELFGIYATTDVTLAGSSFDWDLYWLGLSRDAATFNGTSGDEDRHTLGTRFGGKFGGTGFDADAEIAYQFGEVGSADISAFMFASQFGYSFADATWAPRVYVGFDFASGDDQAGDNDVGTFNQLFPLGHAYNGFIDTVGRQNIIDISAGISLKPADKWTAKLDLHVFNRVETEDALYNAGGGVVRAGAPGTSRDVGQEVDLTLIRVIDSHTKAVAGYSHFFANDFIEETGSSEDIDFLYFMLIYTF